MENFDSYKNKQLQNEIKDAHETALSAEASAKVLSKQALKMVHSGESSAVAKRRLKHVISPANWFGDGVFAHNDPSSVELATNAALRDQNVEVEVIAGHYDAEHGASRDTLVIKKIDGEDV